MNTTENGDAGVNRISAYLAIAAHANIRNGSYAEDSQKCDILFTFKNAFDFNELCEFAGQAKTGTSFFKIDSAQKTVRIDNCSDVKSVVVKSGIPIIIFVDSSNKEIYWYITDLRSKQIKTLKLPQTQIVVPSVWVDFSRIFRYWQYQSNKYLTQTMSKRTFDKNFIKSCKLGFKGLLKHKIYNPLTGDVNITNKAWEHVTRRGRTKLARQLSIRAAVHLGHFLGKNPDRMDQKNVVRVPNNGFIYETREIILFYRKGISFNNSNYTFAVRINELIIYPNNWLERPLSILDIKHKRKVASWWLKKNTY
jgi:hypothetical protein